MKSLAFVLLLAATVQATPCTEADKTAIDALKKQQDQACGANASKDVMCASGPCLDFFKKAAAGAPDCSDGDSSLRNTTITAWLSCLQTTSRVSTCPQAVISEHRQFQESCGPQLPAKDGKPAYCSSDCVMNMKDLISKSDCVANGFRVGDEMQVLMTACGTHNASVTPSTAGPMEDNLPGLPSTPPTHHANATTIDPTTPSPSTAPPAAGSNADGTGAGSNAAGVASSGSGLSANSTVKPVVKKSGATSTFTRACMSSAVAAVAAWCTM